MNDKHILNFKQILNELRINNVAFKKILHLVQNYKINLI